MRNHVSKQAQEYLGNVCLWRRTRCPAKRRINGRTPTEPECNDAGLLFRLSTIFFGKPVSTFPDHAQIPPIGRKSPPD
jgi:hypothetical protein